MDLIFLTRAPAVALLLVSAALPVMSQTRADSGKIPELERRIQQYLEAQKPQLAIPLLREVVSIDPTNQDAQANLGVLLFFDNKYAEAIPPFRAALKLRADLPKVQSLLGLAEKRTGDAAAAQRDLEGAFANLTEPKIRIQTGLELIELFQASGQLGKAQAIAARLEEFDPQSPQVLFVSHELARQTLDQTLLSLMLAAPESAEMHMAMAGELARDGDRTNAIAQYREALRLNPAMPGAHFRLAEELRTAPDPALNEQAEGEYRAALRTNQFDAISWRQLGGILAAKGDLKAAEDSYRKALALQPGDSDAETGLASVLIPLNREGEAIPLLESALRHDPTNGVAHYRLSTEYRRAGRAAEADREMDLFRHYQEIKDKLGRKFRELSGRNAPQ